MRSRIRNGIILSALLLSVRAHADCLDPRAFGAVPNDGKDDAPAIRSALAAANHACLGSGVWDVEYVRGDAIIVGPGQSITGIGPSAVIRQHGDMRGGASNAIAIRGGKVLNVSVAQDITNPDPAGQNHLVAVEDGDGDELQGWLGPMSPGGGDCVRMLGVNNAVTRAKVDAVAFGCTRSGISVQHGVVSATVTGVYNSVNDQAIDYEPTSAGPSSIAFNGVLAICTSKATCVTFSDVGGANMSRFVGGMILDGNVQMVRGAHVDFADNVVIGGDSSAPTFDVIRDSVGLDVHHNVFVRPASAQPGSVVRIVCNEGKCPERAIVDHNQIEQNSAGYAVELEGLQNSIVDHNIVTQAAWTNGYALSCRGLVRPCDGLVVDSNILIGASSTRSALRLSGSSGVGIGRIVATGNITSGYQYTAWCENGDTSATMLASNVGPRSVCGAKQ